MPISSRMIELTHDFYEWERRGRGWDLYPSPVHLEPCFKIPDFQYKRRSVPDDGRTETWLSSIFAPKRQEPPPPEAKAAEEVLPEPFSWSGELVELAVLVPPAADIPLGATVAWLESCTHLAEPIAIELLGFDNTVEFRVACGDADADLVASALRIAAPEVAVYETNASLKDHWVTGDRSDFSCLEFGLGHEFMSPLAPVHPRDPDPLAHLVGAVASVAKGERALVQVLAAPARAPWPDAIRRAVVTPSGQPFFVDNAEFTKRAFEKTEAPLFAAALRVGVCGRTQDSSFEVIRRVASALGRLGSAGTNELIPLAPSELLELDLLERTSCRTGMLLSSHELATLVHLPDSRVVVPELVRLVPGKQAPSSVRADTGTFLGENRVLGQRHEIRLPMQDRLRHVHLLGASGTGKSTLIVRMVLDDISSATNRGIAVLDPHGDLVDEILGRIPDDRIDDVIVFDPSDEEHIVGWNVLEARSEPERQMLASDLVGVFRRLSTSWGDQMTSVLSNVVLSFLDSTRGGTLLDLRQFLVDKKFRDDFLTTVADPYLASYWTTEFPLLVGKRPQGPILTRLDMLLRSKLVRNVVTARKTHIDFRSVVDEGKIFLARLSQGAIGTENAALLGSLLVSKFHQVVLSRQDTDIAERNPFFLYVDEFHELATPSMATLFSGVRKYGLGVSVAHQDLYQLHGKMPEVERAVLANAHTRIVFRVGDDDARKLAPGFASFDAAALTGLGLGEAVCRVGTSADDFNLTTIPLPQIEAADLETRQTLIRARSNEQYGQPRTTPESPQPSPAPKESVQESPTGTPSEHRDIPAHASPPKSDEVPFDEHGEVRAGQGGPEHTYLQGFVSQFGQTRGYFVEIEKEVDGGRIDVALSKGDERVACEISVSTSSGHELENVKKCLAAGYTTIIVISLKKRFLRQFRKLLDERLSGDERKRVHTLTPESLAAFLSEEPIVEGNESGYDVEIEYEVRGSAHENARRRALADLIAQSTKRLNREQKE